MEFVPFGQGGIPPTAEKATKYRACYFFSFMVSINLYKKIG
jgi:hypothetical protein